MTTTTVSFVGTRGPLAVCGSINERSVVIVIGPVHCVDHRCPRRSGRVLAVHRACGPDRTPRGRPWRAVVGRFCVHGHGPSCPH